MPEKYIKGFFTKNINRVSGLAEKTLAPFALNNARTRRRFLQNMGALSALSCFSLLASCGSALNEGEEETGYAASFRITFSKTMDTASVENAISFDPAVSATPSQVSWSTSDSVLYYKITVPGTTTYTVTLAGTTAKDIAGNLLDGNSDGTGGDDYSFQVTGREV